MKDFEKRMFQYCYRIYDNFDREVYAIATMTDVTGNGSPNELSMQVKQRTMTSSVFALKGSYCAI